MKNLPSGVTIAAGGSATYAQLTKASNVDDTLTFLSGADNDEFLIVDGDDIALSATSEFALTAEAGIITYTGDPIIVFCWSSVSFRVNDALSALVFLGVSKNGEFLNEAPFASSFQLLGGCQFVTHFGNFGSDYVYLSSSRLVSLESGDTVQLVGGHGNASNIFLQSASMLITKVGP